MARKSRKVNIDAGSAVVAAEPVVREEADVEVNKPAPTAVYRAAVYARLSNESDDDRDRGTIENQIMFCEKFVETQPDICVEKVYFDISKTGTNFEREGFEEMMEDAKKGFINCIVVKDLSRLGRNYVEAGNYIEKVYPFMGIRFIAITDNYDSSKNNEPMVLGVTNILNEMYSRDISKKIKAAYRAAWEEGKCVAGSLPYGFKRDPKDKSKLVIDEEVVEIVRFVFAEMAKDRPYPEIARELTGRGVLSPRDYKNYKAGRAIKNYKWTKDSIVHIIDNRAYMGDGVHNRYKPRTLGKKGLMENPESEWVVVPNEHEAIVSYELFKKANDIRKQRYAKAKDVKNPGMYRASHLNFFKGKIFCAECGSTMNITHCGWVAVNYFCSGHRKDITTCYPNYVRDTKVNDEVLRVIHTHINVYTDNINIIRRINGKKENAERYAIFNKKVKQLQRELTKIANRRQALYEDYIARTIDAGQYVKFKEEYVSKEEQLGKELKEMIEARARFDVKYKTDKEWSDLIESFRDKRILTKSMVDAFVSKVLIDKNGNALVELLFDDKLKDLVTYARERKAEDENKK